MRTGTAELPLHGGRAPRWLFERMTLLAREMGLAILGEEGTHGLMRRISDPYWFQAFGCVLGFDWHSSGLTTVVTGIMKNVVTLEKHGVKIVGGKGRMSRNAPSEIEEAGSKAGFSTSSLEELKYASRMCA